MSNLDRVTMGFGAIAFACVTSIAAQKHEGMSLYLDMFTVISATLLCVRQMVLILWGKP